jgi:hypothetical protein
MMDSITRCLIGFWLVLITLNCSCQSFHLSPPTPAPVTLDPRQNSVLSLALSPDGNLRRF